MDVSWGTPPVRLVKLVTGDHKVRFVNPSLELAYERVVKVTVEGTAEDPITVGVDLERGRVADPESMS